MTIHVSKDVETAINAAVQSGRFASPDDAVAEIVRDYFSRQQARLAPATPDQARKPVWERILERTAAIPDEEWDKLPTDLAEQHDHYLYGTPKRPTA
jgi:Arc/MetJ-type ribon-helix-helix transcriptional regulator